MLFKKCDFCGKETFVTHYSPENWGIDTEGWQEQDKKGFFVCDECIKEERFDPIAYKEWCEYDWFASYANGY